MTAAAVATPLSAWRPRLHAVAVGVLSGLVVGIPLGALNRVFQRITAIMGDEFLVFTLVGSLGIVFFTVLPFAIPAGVAYFAVRDRLPRSRPTHGLTYGLLLLILLGIPYLWAAPMGINDIGNMWVNRLMYGSLFVLAGLSLPPVAGAVERLVPAGGRTTAVVDGMLAVLALASTGLLLFFAFLLISERG